MSVEKLLARRETGAGAFGAQGLDHFRAHADLTGARLMAHPGIVRAELAGGGEDDDLTVGVAERRIQRENNLRWRRHGRRAPAQWSSIE